MTGDLLRCREPFTCTGVDGVPVVLKVGDLRRSGDPVVRGREQFFEPAEQATAVEQATAAPGERRAGLSRRGKKDPAADPQPTPTPTED